MLKNIIVRGRDFDDENWEDPTLSGWLMLYCVWLLFAIVMGVASVFQLPYAPGWAKALGYSTYLLPVYSLVGVMMRFRDAVATSIVSLLLFILTSIANFVVLIASNEVAAAVWTAVLGVGVNVCWMVYFLKSHLVAVRFPKEERRVFVADWFLFVFSIGIGLLLNLSALGNLENYKINSSDEYQETMLAAKGLMDVNEHDIHFVDCRIDKKYCIVYFAADDGNISEEKFDSIVRQPYFSDMLLFNMDKKAPGFVKSAIGDGLVLVLSVFRKTVNDGVTFKITPDQILNLEDPEPLPDFTEEELDHISKTVGSMIPSSNIRWVSMKSTEWLNEVVLLVNFEVDEDKTQYVDAYGDFKEYADEMKKMLMMNRGQSVLDAIWTRNMSIKFVLKGSKTGYTQEIIVF